MEAKNRYNETETKKIIEWDLVNSDGYSSDSDWDLCSVYILEELTFYDKVRLINDVGFELLYEVSSKYYFLEDRQGANLGGIEGEMFKGIDEVIARLKIYFYDYGICVIPRELFKKIAKRGVK